MEGGREGGRGMWGGGGNEGGRGGEWVKAKFAHFFIFYFYLTVLVFGSPIIRNLSLLV